MKDGGNLDDVMPEPIHDTVVAVDDLADSFVAKLRHDASRARVVLESLHSGDDAFDDEIGVVRRVTGYMRAYRLDVLDRLRRPDDPGSPEKSALRLSVVDSLPSVQFRQPPLGLCQEHQAFDGVLQRGIGWQLLDRLEDPLFSAARHLPPPWPFSGTDLSITELHGDCRGLGAHAVLVLRG